MKRVIRTIGYEGTAIGEFIAALRAERVELVLDIREAPISRKKGFSRSALEAALGAAGIGYEHLRALGTPRTGREAARAGDRETFRRVFEAQLRTDEAARDMKRAIVAARTRAVCLLCFERDHRMCHRDIVADRLARKADLAIRHLEVPAADAR